MCQDWSRRQESNLYLTLRRHTFYPLNYGETRCEQRQALFSKPAILPEQPLTINQGLIKLQSKTNQDR